MKVRETVHMETIMEQEPNDSNLDLWDSVTEKQATDILRKLELIGDSPMKTFDDCRIIRTAVRFFSTLILFLILLKPFSSQEMTMILSTSQNLRAKGPSQARPINLHLLQLVDERSSIELSEVTRGMEGSISFRSHTGATTNTATMSSTLWWRQEQRT